MKKETLSWRDDTVVPRENWVGAYGRDALDGLAQGQRHVFPTQGAICSFAYAVTLKGAQKLLQVADDVGEEAYDVTLQRACQRGRGDLRCLSIVDELFHHYKPAECFGESSDIAEEAAGESEERRGRIERTPGLTENILRSARCKALFNTTCNGLPESIILTNLTEPANTRERGRANLSSAREEVSETGTAEQSTDLAKERR